MRGVGAIWRRELAALFLAPLAWVLLCLALLYQGFFFLHHLRLAGGGVDEAVEHSLGHGLSFWVLLALLPPLLTMRMISEEARSGMLELLLTAPVTDRALVVGKALAATAFLALVWAAVPLYALVLQLLGATPDWGLVAAGWLGAVLASSLFVALGLLCSASTDAPLVAAFVATVAGVLVVFLPLAGGGVRAMRPELVDWLTARLGVAQNLQASFMTGAVDSAHVVFFVAWTAVLLFATVRVVEARRWLR